MQTIFTQTGLPRQPPCRAHGPPQGRRAGRVEDWARAGKRPAQPWRVRRGAVAGGLVGNHASSGEITSQRPGSDPGRVVGDGDLPPSLTAPGTFYGTVPHTGEQASACLLGKTRGGAYGVRLERRESVRNTHASRLRPASTYPRWLHTLPLSCCQDTPPMGKPHNRTARAGVEPASLAGCQPRPVELPCNRCVVVNSRPHPTAARRGSQASSFAQPPARRT